MSIMTSESFHYSSTSRFCKETFPTMTGSGLLDKVEDVKIGNVEKSKSKAPAKLAPGVLASFMIH